MSISEKLNSALSESAGIVEQALKGLPMFTGENRQPGFCSYSLNAGGKRLRPFLVLQSCAAIGGCVDNSIHAACSVEMIHTYSLIHDDLPGMDDDDTRRGKPSLHVISGTRNALFSGDRLLIESFKELSRTPLPEPVVKAMLSRLVNAAGASFLAGGQFMDMYHPPAADSNWTHRMIAGKTAAMIRVSLELGSMAAGFSGSELESISSIGDDIGFLFQLTDDILDVTGTSQEMGKAVAKDARKGKWNPVSSLGVDGAENLAIQQADAITIRLKKLPGNWQIISELVENLPERRR
jgi:geranylgeranyl pyrophosphate synthase